MTYDYKKEKPELSTKEGQILFIEIRDRVKNLLRQAGAVRTLEAIKGSTGDSWHMLACVDRLVELGEIREITGPNVAGQHRVFVSTKGEN